MSAMNARPEPAQARLLEFAVKSRMPCCEGCIHADVRYERGLGIGRGRRGGRGERRGVVLVRRRPPSRFPVPIRPAVGHSGILDLRLVSSACHVLRPLLGLVIMLDVVPGRRERLRELVRIPPPGPSTATFWLGPQIDPRRVKGYARTAREPQEPTLVIILVHQVCL